MADAGELRMVAVELRTPEARALLLELVRRLDELLAAYEVAPVTWELKTTAEGRVQAIAHIPADCRPELQRCMAALTAGMDDIE